VLGLTACSSYVRPATPPAAVGGVAVTPSAAAPAQAVPPEERAWAKQALLVLAKIDQGVQDYHNATEFPPGAPRRLQLSQSAYGRFSEAVAEHQALLPVTENIRDASLRDPFMFVLGNIGGFLTPAPDLLGDPPTLGDRIARSLENAIATSASLRPKLERIAGSA
jgi:hypothetical protein